MQEIYIHHQVIEINYTVLVKISQTIEYIRVKSRDTSKYCSI